MNFFIGIVLLLPVWAKATNNTPNRARGGGGVPLQFSQQVVLDDTGRVGLLEILESQEPADAVFDFAKHHNLDLTQQHSLLDSICQSMSCTRKEALLFSVPVDFGNDKPVDFQLFQGSEPADAVDEFVKKHNLPENYHSAIMKRACNAQAVECKRLEPVIWKKTVNIDNKWEARIEILRGQEPADVIFAALKPYSVTFDGRQQLFHEVKQAQVPYSREYALLLSQNITLEDDETFSQKLMVYDDGKEPIDVLYDFTVKNSIDRRFKDLSKAMLPELCELVGCKRDRPSIWQRPIKGEDGKTLGTLIILLGDEPIDVIDRFVQGLDAKNAPNRHEFRHKLWDVVCQSVKCTRSVPVVYRKSIKNEHGRHIGEVEILENQEVIDGTVAFLQKTNQVSDEIALKNYMLQDACRNPRVKCTRNVAIVFTKKFKRENGSPFNTLIIYENEEPADKVYQFCQEENSIEYYDGIIEIVCESVKCRRTEAVYFSIPISGPDGEFIDTFQIKVNEEPIDAMYKFFSKNGLFKKKWDFDGIVSQICAKPNVPCKRRVPLKYLDRNFTMGGINMGQLEIWGQQEVVDVLYNLRQAYNLTEVDQIESFSAICHSGEVHCERTKAVVYLKTEITRLDFEKFGNETCKRQFVGVKFRSSFVNLPFGSTLSDFLKKDSSKAVVEHPLFCMLVLLVLQTALRLVTALPSVKKHINRHQRAVIAFWIFILVSVLQAVLVEPDVAVDEAMHTFEGKLPDLVIYEGEEPVDALVKWGKEASKVGTDANSKQEDWRPVVREPIYYEILDELCNRVDGLQCSRQRAWEFLSMGGMTYFGQEYPVEIYNPMVDPIGREECLFPESDGFNTCVQASAEQFCARLHPPAPNCEADIAKHISTQLEEVDSKRLDEKCSYQRLGLEIDAPGYELYKKTATVARSRGMNISPFRRVDNGTQPFYSWSKETAEAHAAIDTFHKVHDPESREWNDKPCTPYFGGALCAKYDKDGNMKIEV